MRLLHPTTVLTVLCSKGASALFNQTRMFASSRLLLEHLERTESTQDVAKQTIPSLSKNQILAVTATEQTNGRGTSGRAWMGLKGNVFLSVALQSKEVPTTLTLLPLQVGILIAERIDKIMKQICRSPDVTVKLKWPNDVLVNQQKVAGVLIESMVIDGDIWLIIGIGVNIAVAPQVPTEGPNRGRPATCLQEFCRNSQEPLPASTANLFAQDFAEGLVQWLEQPTSSNAKVIDDWKRWANFGLPQVIRETNERVIPIDIQQDGQLVVRGEDGRERLLVADYLF
jgi:BirA family transcriptional regulator, biotin operon repressor / biotin---[acetyl-CoA-carboxylase] ligase